MSINTEFLIRCINTLESVLDQLQQREPADPFYDILRAASIKEFEIVLEQSGNLLKKRLRPYFASNRPADRLTFKNVLRIGTTGTILRTTMARSSRKRLSNCCRTSSRTPGTWRD